MYAAPVSNKDRITLLDALRGIAILGILLLNIYMGGQYWDTLNLMELMASPWSLDYISTMLGQVLFEGKMRALFCILFGAGIMLFLEKKKDVKNLGKLHFSRMFWLLIFGLFNAYVLLFDYDILYHYAIIGAVVFFIRKLNPYLKLLLVFVVLMFGFVMSNLDYQEEREKYLSYKVLADLKEKGIALSAAQTETYDQWREDNSDKSQADIEEHAKLMRGSITDVASYVFPENYRKQLSIFFKRVADPLSLIILGMALYSIGFLTGKWKQQHYIAIMLVGYFIGLPLVMAELQNHLLEQTNSELRLSRLESNIVTYQFFLYQLSRACLVMAHISAIILLYQGGFLKSLFRRFEAVGQMALTNYLMQSIILVLFFYGFGLGFYDKLSYSQLYLLVLAVWILQLWYSPLWLEHFRFGPFEWVWRCLTYWKLFPLQLQRNSQLKERTV